METMKCKKCGSVNFGYEDVERCWKCNKRLHKLNTTIKKRNNYNH